MLTSYRRPVAQVACQCLQRGLETFDRMFKAPGPTSENLFTRIDRLVKTHSYRVTKGWFGHEPRSNLFLIFALVLIALAALGNVKVRHSQQQIWQSGPATQIFGTPSFSTADAPYFLNHSANTLRGEQATAFNSIRAFPNNIDILPNDQSTVPHNVPLLSFLIARFAGDDDPSRLLATGNMGLLLSSALTAVAIAICFGASGYWAHGAVAGVGGGLSAAYLVRSSIGRIDTDQLNLGFMYLMIGLVVLAGRASSKLCCLGWCVAAGISANLFMWWYGKPELIVMATIALAWLLVCLHRQIPTVLTGTAIFLVVSGVTTFNPFTSTYLKEVLVDASFIFRTPSNNN